MPPDHSRSFNGCHTQGLSGENCPVAVLAAGVLEASLTVACYCLGRWADQAYIKIEPVVLGK